MKHQSAVEQQRQMSERYCSLHRENDHIKTDASHHPDFPQEKQYPTCGSCPTNAFQQVNHISMVTVCYLSETHRQPKVYLLLYIYLPQNTAVLYLG